METALHTCDNPTFFTTSKVIILNVHFMVKHNLFETVL